jgi:hypothetical protein
MKVYGGRWRRGSRCIIAAKSGAEAVRILKRAGVHFTSHEFKLYWSQTSNVDDLRIALSKPGTPFEGEDRFGRSEYHEVDLKPV